MGFCFFVEIERSAEYQKAISNKEFVDFRTIQCFQDIRFVLFFFFNILGINQINRKTRTFVFWRKRVALFSFFCRIDKCLRAFFTFNIIDINVLEKMHFSWRTRQRLSCTECHRSNKKNIVVSYANFFLSLAVFYPKKIEIRRIWRIPIQTRFSFLFLGICLLLPPYHKKGKILTRS